jgi:hypothetical protein
MVFMPQELDSPLGLSLLEAPSYRIPKALPSSVTDFSASENALPASKHLEVPFMDCFQAETLRIAIASSTAITFESKVVRSTPCQTTSFLRGIGGSIPVALLCLPTMFPILQVWVTHECLRSWCSSLRTPISAFLTAPSN